MAGISPAAAGFLIVGLILGAGISYAIISPRSVNTTQVPSVSVTTQTVTVTGQAVVSGTASTTTKTITSTSTMGQTTSAQGNGFLVSIVVSCTRCSSAQIYTGKTAEYNGTLLNSTVAYSISYITKTPIFGNGTTTLNYFIPSPFFLNGNTVSYSWTFETLNANGGTLEVRGYVNSVLVTDQTVTPPYSRQALTRIGPWEFSFSGYTQLAG